jgi:hypothetical protein
MVLTGIACRETESPVIKQCNEDSRVKLQDLPVQAKSIESGAEPLGNTLRQVSLDKSDALGIRSGYQGYSRQITQTAMRPMI